MVDAAGRAQLLALLRSLVTRDRMAVVHVTHRSAESAVGRPHDRARRRARRARARGRSRRSGGCRAGEPARRGDPLLLLRDVGHVYSRDTPWAHRALADVNLRIDRGEAVLVVGHNGSGKSTLAWMLAGLLDPSEGEARLEGQPLHTVVGQVGVAFQHARLQLLRPTVFAEVTRGVGRRPGRRVAGARRRRIRAERDRPAPRRRAERRAKRAASCSRARSRRGRARSCSTSRSPGSTTAPAAT